MNIQEVLTCILIFLGAGVMLFSILGTRRILTLLRASKYMRLWRALFVLMIGFLGGYLGTIVLVVLGHTNWVLVSVGLVFFFGALFVLLVVRTGYLTMEFLDSKVAERTAELAERTAELERAYEQLAEHDRLKSRFFSNISHEVRTPLTLILTPLERILASPLPAPTRDKIRSVRDNAHRLLRLVNQLLDFSRIESGRMTVALESIDLRALVAPIVQAFEPFAATKGLELSLEAPEDLPTAAVDPAKLDKVVSNLLSNACKFAESGGKVTLRLARGDDALLLSVIDTGIGVAQEDLPRIFERFHQVDGGAARRYEGSGIGLALSKELVELCGGRIEVESELGRGTTFRVTLPLGDADRSDAAPVPSAARVTAAALSAETGAGRPAAPRDAADNPSAEAPEATGARPSVLVVEDNPDMRALVAEICRREYRVLEAANGREGLELVHAEHPELVISDVMMPEMDGYELLRGIRADETAASTPVILLTAKADPERLLEGLETGANDYITKPFAEHELLARARNLVRLAQQDRQLRQLNATLHQQVVRRSLALQRARLLQRYLPADVARSLLEEEDGAKELELQRRLITVFQLELGGFDQLVGQVVAPEDLAVMVNSYLSEMMDIALAHGATVDKLIEHTVVGFFGAPRSEGPGGDALRCARMAQEVWQSAVRTCLAWGDLLEGAPPMPTMVLMTGYATVGSFGSSQRLEYTAVGEPLVEARGVLAAVKPGALLCSHKTYHLIKGDISATFCRDVPLQMRPRPLKLYRLAEAPRELVALCEGEFVDDEAEFRDEPTPETLPGSLPGSSSGSPSSRSARTRRKEIGPGTVINARYEVVRVLGRGGMGNVYLAQDLKLETNVALKMMHHHLQMDSSQAIRIYREVKLARLISHPNAARIFDIDNWRGLEFITMEYIAGVTLKQRIQAEGAFPLDEGVRVVRELCLGLGAAHAAHIVHRDLKPSNVMLRRDGRVVILDFGIAKSVALQDTGSHDRALGTPHYMAPEQFKGEEVDGRTDIYSLGVVAYEIFTGRRPFAGENLATLGYKHAHERPEDPMTLRPDLPPRLAAVILGCLEKDPRDRFNAVSEIVSLLGSVAPRSLPAALESCQ
jgi:signal transduction histidine kinase/DNA-binding response OmpR family regulator